MEPGERGRRKLAAILSADVVGYSRLMGEDERATVDTLKAYRAAIKQLVDPVLAIPTGPAIAVLPFTNLSGDPKQDYFADGITEQLITELTRWNLRVIARNSTFRYKRQAVDVRQVGRELGVRYVLEGSVRREPSGSG